MARFSREKSYHWIKPALSVVLFLAVFLLFLLGISEISKKTEAQRALQLKQSISQGIAHCYSVNGYYPDNLADLMTQYDIRYDTEEFFVDYQVMGENIFPDVTIIEK